MHPNTQALVNEFAAAMTAKLERAEQKYGYRDNWLTDNWEAECRQKLVDHIDKGDPLDVAAYCAFMWRRGWSTASKVACTVCGEVVLAVAAQVMTTCAVSAAASNIFRANASVASGEPMSHDLQQMIGVAIIIFAICSGVGACSYGLGAGLALKTDAENSARR